MEYLIYNNNLKVLISNHGAEIKSIKSANYEFIHDANPLYWNRSAPLLFPNIGGLKDQYTIFNNQQYPLTKHGFIRDVDFTLTKKTKEMIELQFQDNEHTYKLYPFHFRFIVIYQLIDNRIESYIKIINLDEKPLPFNIGLHPAFHIPFEKDYQFEDYLINFHETISIKSPQINHDGTIDWQKITKDVTQSKLPLNHEDYQNDAIIINPMPKGGKISVKSLSGNEIVIDAPQFKTLGIWTTYPKHSPFICIEPWIGYNDDKLSNHDFYTKADLITLKPQEIYNLSYSYTFNIKK